MPTCRNRKNHKPNIVFFLSLAARKTQDAAKCIIFSHLRCRTDGCLLDIRTLPPLCTTRRRYVSAQSQLHDTHPKYTHGHTVRNFWQNVCAHHVTFDREKSHINAKRHGFWCGILDFGMYHHLKSRTFKLTTLFGNFSLASSFFLSMSVLWGDLQCRCVSQEHYARSRASQQH